jgi:hypothetical protein
MKNNRYLTTAAEIEALIGESVKSDPSKPVIDESYLVAAAPTQSPEATAVAENETLLPDLVKSIVEYAMRQAPASATPSGIGQAICEGVFVAANHLKLDNVKLVEAVDAFLEELHSSVLETLAEG